jgi:hypothetical protein
MATDIEYLDEELDDIEYTEILTFEEMSRINPSFIALDKEEIYNSLYVFFKDKKKADQLRSLFYEILENRESKNGKIKDYSNYIFAAEGELENYGSGEGDGESSESGDPKDAVYNFIGKYNNKSDLREFTKRKFAVSYDRKSNKIRLKPTHNTTIVIGAAAAAQKDFPKYHQIIKDYPVVNCDSVEKVENIYNINDTDDDGGGGSGGSSGISLPILGAYYKIPTTTVNDYMYAKIASHLLNSVNTTYRAASASIDICDLIKKTRPDIEMSIKEINSNKDAFYLDYGNINNILKKYDYSLDFITEKDLEVLTECMYSIIKGEKERKHGAHGAFKIKRPVLINKKLTFYDNIEKTLKIINISPQVKSFLEKTKDIILKYKNDIIQTEVIALKNYNVYDIIKQINDDAITIEEIIDELKLSIKTINIDNALETINDILEAQENLEDIKEDCDNVKKYFVYSREHIFDYDKDGKKYVISKRENKAISDGNDIDNYEGLKDDDDIIEDENKGFVGDADDVGVGGSGVGIGVGSVGIGGIGVGTVATAVNNNYDINRYIANIHFRNDKAFIEILKIILELVKKINDVANIDIDYDALSNHIFQKYRSILTITRYEIYLKKLKKLKVAGAAAGAEDIKKYAKKYAERVPLYLDLCLSKNNLDKRHKWYEDIRKATAEEFINKAHIDIVKTANKEFVAAINSIFYEAICFWIVDTQENLLKNNIALNANMMNPRHIDTFNSKGLLYYIIELSIDHFRLSDDNDYMINTDALQKTLVNIIKNGYKDKGEAILNELINKKNIDAKNRCSVDRNRYTDEEQYYIDKLLLTPNINSKYEKIHKYIQGCCLRKLNNDFNDISDFVNNDNTEIIKLKEHYSKVNLNNKERDTRYTLPRLARLAKIHKKGDKDASDDDADDGDIFANEVRDKVKHIKYVVKKPFVYNFKNYGVDEWLDEMDGKSPLLPSNLIVNLKNYNIDAVKQAITDNIKRLKNIKSNVSGDFLNCAYVNYKEILLNICKILYVCKGATAGATDDVFQDRIMNSIKDIKKMAKYLYDLNKNYDADDEVVVNIINLAVIANCLNYPDLLGVENIPKKFVADKADKLYEYLKTYLEGKYNKFLSPEEITVFLDKKREEYKIKKLKDNADLDVEQNDIRRQMKAAGIKDAYNTNKDSEAGDAGGDGVDGGDARDAGGADAADAGGIADTYKNDEKDADYNSKDNDNYNIYDDEDYE